MLNIFDRKKGSKYMEDYYLIEKIEYFLLKNHLFSLFEINSLLLL